MTGVKSENIFSDSKTTGLEHKIKNSVFEKTGEKILNSIQLPGGVNSFVFQLFTENGKEYLAKNYIVRKGDTRDRITTEYSGLVFLWNNGIRSIPKPIFMDRENQIGLYGFIKGCKLKPGEITLADIDQTIMFLEAISSFINLEYADRQPVASEACFSIMDYIYCIESRLHKLKSLPCSNELLQLLHKFLDYEFISLFIKIRDFVKGECNRLKMDTSVELPKTGRILSPSDFGFHNVIKCYDGTLAFIDFEYYGWDDPAKLISDFYLQPEVPLPNKYRKYFFEKTNAFMGNDVFFVKRLPLAYILSSLKWCLIMLNVFVWSTFENRFNRELCTLQMRKAKDKLIEIEREFQGNSFPLSLLGRGFGE